MVQFSRFMQTHLLWSFSCFHPSFHCCVEAFYPRTLHAAATWPSAPAAGAAFFSTRCSGIARVQFAPPHRQPLLRHAKRSRPSSLLPNRLSCTKKQTRKSLRLSIISRCLFVTSLRYKEEERGGGGGAAQIIPQNRKDKRD